MASSTSHHAPLNSPSASNPTSSAAATSSCFPFAAPQRQRSSLNATQPLTAQPFSTSHPSHPQPTSFPQSSLSHSQSSSQQHPPTSNPQQLSQSQQQQQDFHAGRSMNESRREETLALDRFCLVAEAAKRAEMAVLMRDLGECAL